MAFLRHDAGNGGENLGVGEVSLGLSELRIRKVERSLSRDDGGFLGGHVSGGVRLNLGQMTAERDELCHLLAYVVFRGGERLPERVDVGVRGHGGVHVLIEVGLRDSALGDELLRAILVELHRAIVGLGLGELGGELLDVAARR